jgi:hypothetical protein
LGLTTTLDSLALGPHIEPKSIGSSGTIRPRELGSASCHTQVTWVSRPFPDPKKGLEGDARPKLIIIMIIITTTIIIIDFTLQIKFIFFQ